MTPKGGIVFLRFKEVILRDERSTEPKLREIGMGDRKAEPGKFRAITVVDSCPYQVGEDVDDLRVAELLAHKSTEMGGMDIQVYDDLGYPRMKGSEMGVRDVFPLMTL